LDDRLSTNLVIRRGCVEWLKVAGLGRRSVRARGRWRQRELSAWPMRSLTGNSSFRILCWRCPPG